MRRAPSAARASFRVNQRLLAAEIRPPLRLTGKLRHQVQVRRIHIAVCKGLRLGKSDESRRRRRFSRAALAA